MSQIAQLFPPTAKFTEKELPDQSGKVRNLLSIAVVFPAANCAR